MDVACPQPKGAAKTPKANKANKNATRATGKGFLAYVVNLSGDYLDLYYKGEHVASIDEIEGSSYVSAATLICVDGRLSISWQNST